jgi:hypothetical protein
MKKHSSTQARPLAYRIPPLSEATGVGRTKIYEEIAAGRLIASKVGSITIVTHPNALRWLRSLPTTQATETMATADCESLEIESLNILENNAAPQSRKTRQFADSFSTPRVKPGGKKS